MKWILIYALIINLIAYGAMGIDKRRSVKKKRRIPEKTLFMFVLLGGGIGGTAGMYVFRHKTKHWYFVLGFPLIALIELVGSALLYYYVFM
ncbi:MAG: DUF1294 domain-containing protein [Ruminococcus sp.]